MFDRLASTTLGTKRQPPSQRQSQPQWRLSVATFCALTLFAAGCGGGQRGADAFESQFPTESELQAALESHDTAYPRIGDQSVILRSWSFEGLSDRLGLRDADVPAPFSPVLGARHTAGAHCVAAQLARFATEYDVSPSMELIATWRQYCGSTLASVAMYFGCIEGDPNDAELAEMLPALNELPPGSMFGVATARTEAKTCAAAAWGNAAIELDDGSAVAAGGSIRITGQVVAAFEEVVGSVTAGPHGAALCQVDTSVSAPQFGLICPLLGGSDVWLVNVQSRSPGRLLFDKSITIAVFADARPEREWTLRVPALPGDSVAERLLAATNGLRSSAGQPPMALSEPQSSNQCLAVGPMFDSSVDNTTRDMVALGLMAGWHVEQKINNASLFSASSPAQSTDDDLVAYLLEQPSVRLALLNPSTSVLAVGDDALNEYGARGLVVTTYSSIDADTDAIATAMRARVDAARQARGLTPTETLSSAGEAAMRRSVGALRSTERGVAEELGNAMQAVVDATRTAVGGQYWMLVSSVDAIPVPAAWLEGERLRLSLRAELFTPRGSPWASYAIMAVTQ
ncbi:MAG: hypothetical protein ACJA1R_003094 [Flavobacteriales bacterium]|jgi:hypothetical protein